jgi:hypothetical protein
LYGLNASEISLDYEISAEGFDYLLSLIQKVNRDGVYWDIIEEVE